MQRKYYEAYDDRYRQIHSQNLAWFDESPSAIVLETIREFGKYHVFPGCSVGKESACNAGDCLQCRRPRFDTWVWRITWKRE